MAKSSSFFTSSSESFHIVWLLYLQSCWIIGSFGVLNCKTEWGPDDHSVFIFFLAKWQSLTSQGLFLTITSKWYLKSFSSEIHIFVDKSMDFLVNPCQSTDFMDFILNLEIYLKSSDLFVFLSIPLFHISVTMTTLVRVVNGAGTVIFPQMLFKHFIYPGWNPQIYLVKLYTYCHL